MQTVSCCSNSVFSKLSYCCTCNSNPNTYPLPNHWHCVSPHGAATNLWCVHLTCSFTFTVTPSTTSSENSGWRSYSSQNLWHNDDIIFIFDVAAAGQVSKRHKLSLLWRSGFRRSDRGTSGRSLRNFVVTRKVCDWSLRLVERKGCGHEGGRGGARCNTCLNYNKKKVLYYNEYSGRCIGKMWLGRSLWTIPHVPDHQSSTWHFTATPHADLILMIIHLSSLS